MVEGFLENLTGGVGGVNGSGNPDGRGLENLRLHRNSSSIHFFFNSIISVQRGNIKYKQYKPR